jgi:hypothetical protein
MVVRRHCGERTVCELSALINTGDLVLFRGATPWSEVVRWFSWSNESHVGLADRTEAGLFIFESVRNIDGTRDLITDTVRNGVRLVEFAARSEAMFVDQCCDMLDVSIVRLTASPAQLNQFQQRLWSYECQVAGRAYERDAYTIVASQFPLLLGPNVNDESTMFCSELVAAALRETGVFPAQTISSRVTHAMLAHAAEVFHRRWATRGVFYQPIIECYQMKRDEPECRPILESSAQPIASPLADAPAASAAIPASPPPPPRQSELDVVIFL